MDHCWDRVERESLIVSDRPTFELEKYCDLEQEVCCEYIGSSAVLLLALLLFADDFWQRYAVFLVVYPGLKMLCVWENVLICLRQSGLRRANIVNCVSSGKNAVCISFVGKTRAVIHFNSVPVISLIDVVKLPMGLYVWYEYASQQLK